MARIMVVDDSLFMRRMVMSILTDLGHEVVAEASNGMDAVKTYFECDADLVLMDITMPEMNGIAALQEIKRTKADARIIVVSAMGQKYFIEEAAASGADDFIVKPFEKDRAREAVERVLGKSK